MNLTYKFPCRNWQYMYTDIAAKMSKKGLIKMRHISKPMKDILLKF